MTVQSLSPRLHAAYMRAATALVLVKPTLTAHEAHGNLLESFGPLHAQRGETEAISALETVAEVYEREAAG